MKYLPLIFLCMFASQVRAQHSEISSPPVKGDWIVTAYFGNATLTAKNEFKVNASVAGGFLGKEFVVGNAFSIVAGVTNQHVRASYNSSEGASLFITNNSLQVPVTVRYSGRFENTFSYYVSIGGYGSYLYSSSIENEASGNEEETNGLGFNFGLLAAIGIKKQFSEHLSFTVGLKTQGDQFQNYKKDRQEFTLTNVHLFEVGLGYIF